MSPRHAISFEYRQYSQMTARIGSTNTVLQQESNARRTGLRDPSEKEGHLLASFRAVLLQSPARSSMEYAAEKFSIDQRTSSNALCQQTRRNLQNFCLESDTGSP